MSRGDRRTEEEKAAALRKNRHNKYKKHQAIVARDERYRSVIASMKERDRGVTAPPVLFAGPLVIRKGDVEKILPPYTPAELAQITKDRIPLSRRERVAVLRRDRYRCRYCGTKRGPFHVDHVIPVILGGSNDPSNLVCACKPCNLKKGMQIWIPSGWEGTLPDVARH